MSEQLEDITPEGSAAPVYLDPTPIEPVEPPIVEPDYRELRHQAYTAPDGPDAIFMKWQRGEASEQDWLDAVAAIKQQYPEPAE